VRHAFEIAENFILSLDSMSANGDAPLVRFLCKYLFLLVGMRIAAVLPHGNK